MATSSVEARAPKANKGPASLIYFYYGDSKYETLGQETLSLRKSMKGYKRKVLLKHEEVSSLLDINEQDEKLADVKEIPTRSNLFKYLVQLAEEGYYIDLFLFTHGWPGKFRASKGRHGSEGHVTVEDIQNELSPEKTGLTKIPIRIVWGTNCYGATMADAWRAVGAKTVAGSRYVNFYPNAYSNFIDDWNKGDVAFEKAVRDSDSSVVRTATQTYLLTYDAPTKEKAKKWGGCPFGDTILGDNPCARDYFTSVWIANNEWQKGKSGKENMNHSSYMVITGDKRITKAAKPAW